MRHALYLGTNVELGVAVGTTIAIMEYGPGASYRMPS